MKLLDNQRGAALVVVLGIIMLLVIFTSVLTVKMTNTQKQISETDRSIDALNVAQMGLDRGSIIAKTIYTDYEERVEQERITNNSNGKALEIFEKEIKQIAEKVNGKNCENMIMLDQHHAYCIKSSEPIETKGGKPSKILLTAIGKSYGEKTVEKTSVITIKEE